MAVLAIVPVKKFHGWSAVKRESQEERKRGMDLHMQVRVTKRWKCKEKVQRWKCKEKVQRSKCKEVQGKGEGRVKEISERNLQEWCQSRWGEISVKFTRAFAMTADALLYFLCECPRIGLVLL